MKLSISLPAEDVALLDEFADASGLASRSAVLRHAVGLLRHANLGEDYAQAWEDWDASGDRASWEATVADGLTDAPR